MPINFLSVKYFKKGGREMKDFYNFVKYCKQNKDSIINDAINNMREIPIEKRTMTDEERKWIIKTIFKINYSILHQYHDWLNQN